MAYTGSGETMKHKKRVLGIALVFTLLVTSVCISHLSKAAAARAYQPLAGVRVVLDPGHGGKDGGARSGQLEEQGINLKIAEKLAALLEKSGGSVVMTRTGAYDLASKNAPNRKKEDMKKRLELINEEHTDLFLSIHLNAYPNTSVKGAQVFYEKENEVSEAFAKLLQKHLKAAVSSNMSAKAGDYYLLKHAKKIGALVECGFLSNAEDREKLQKAAYQETLAQALYAGILEYFRILY